MKDSQPPERPRPAHSAQAGRRWAMAALSWPFIAAIRIYQITLSPLFGGQCRYEPTCSVYAAEAYRRFGPLRGTWLTARRVLRCHPFVRGGYDPVPVKQEESGEQR